MCYIYSYVNKNTGKTYIGSRCKYTGTPESDFNIKYFSSSKNQEFINDMKNGLLIGNILLVMNNPSECIKLENLMIKSYWEQYGKENSYNKSYVIGNDKQFSAAGLHINSGINNPMYGVEPWNKGKKGLQKSSFKGKHHTKETKLKMSQNHKNVCGENNPMYGKNPPKYTAKIISKNIIIKRSLSQLNRWYKNDYIILKDED